MKETETTAQANGLAEILERLGKGAGILSAAALLLSIFYDYSFLTALGLQFSEVPTSISDHLRSAIVWLPGWIPLLALIALAELVTRRMVGFNPAWEKTRRHEDITVYIGVVIFIIYGVFFSTSYSSFYYTFFFCWALATVWAMGHPRFRAKFNLLGILAFLLIPMFIAGVGGSGYSRGETMLAAAKPTWRVMLKVDDTVQEVDVNGLRRFAEVAILVTPDKRVRVVAGDQVVSATTLLPNEPRKALACTWLPAICKFKVLTAF